MIKTASAAFAALCFLTGTTQAATSCTLKQVGELPISIVGGELVVDAFVNGSPVKLQVNTGASFSALFLPAAQKLGLQPKQILGAKVYGPGGTANMFEVGVKTLKVGGYEADGINFQVVERQSSQTSAGWLGTTFLMHYDAEYDLPDGKLRFFKA